MLSFLSNENCFAGHSSGPCGPRFFEHHWSTVSSQADIFAHSFSHAAGWDRLVRKIVAVRISKCVVAQNECGY